MSYNDLSDEQAIDEIVKEVEMGMVDAGRCNAGWAMLARLNRLRKVEKKLKIVQEMCERWPFTERSDHLATALLRVIKSDD